MKFIDFHCDTASLLLEDINKNLKASNLKVDIEKLTKGQALAQFFALFIDSGVVESSYDKCVNMLNNIKCELKKNNDSIILCRNFEDYNNAKNKNKIGAFITIEEGEAIEGNLEKLKFFKNQGVSLVTLTWNYENSIGYPNFGYKFKEKGLKKFGKEVIEMMNDLGMIIDVSHLSDGGFWDVVNKSKYPIIASHSNSRESWNHSRNLTDSMIKALSNNGGVTGINFCSNFLGKNKIASIEDMIIHIKHIRNIGGIECIALGSDFDGIENEVEIKDCSEMNSLALELIRNGFNDDEIEKIFYKNAERLIKDVLK